MLRMLKTLYLVSLLLRLDDVFNVVLVVRNVAYFKNLHFHELWKSVFDNSTYPKET